ncbi:MAG TPA: hypothetical protein VM008_12710 [Phycisphaerae bacterium]|nr:hypothetical protein [Phycisphaerae bacterium]
MIPVHLLIHVVVQSVSAKASACRVRRVTCEHCGCGYIYQLRRTATGTAQSYMFMGRGGKKQAAEIAARGKLEKILAEAIDVVPCPECGNLQTNMLRCVRRTALRMIAISSGFGAVIVGMFWLGTNQFLGGLPFVPVAEAATAIFAACLCLSLMWALFRDFNAGAHRRTRAALGTRCRAMPAEEFDALLTGENADAIER